MEPQRQGRTAVAFDFPAGGLKGSQNMGAFDVLKGAGVGTLCVPAWEDILHLFNLERRTR